MITNALPTELIALILYFAALGHGYKTAGITLSRASGAAQLMARYPTHYADMLAVGSCMHEHDRNEIEIVRAIAPPQTPLPPRPPRPLAFLARARRLILPAP